MLLVSEFSVHHGGGEGVTGSRVDTISKGPRQDLAPQDIPPVTYFLHPGPTFQSSTTSQ
jgi:hypothetical protein